MRGLMWRWAVLMLLVSIVLSFRRPKDDETERALLSLFSSVSASSSGSISPAPQDSSQETEEPKLYYDFYRETCPSAEKIIRSTMNQIYSENKETPPQLLRLLFHDCFIQGCDASILLDDINGDVNNKSEKGATPNLTVKGFDRIDKIKAELEKACPGTVSCSDILALATRDSLLLAGGPFYPLSTGRRDSPEPFYDLALAEIPKPTANISTTLELFGSRQLNERETVALLGAHNIGKIDCDFIRERLDNLQDKGQPDSTMPTDFINEMRIRCNNSTNNGKPGSKAMYYNELLPIIPSGTIFGTHYYQSLLRGRGLLFADQQLMADQRTARLVRIYASDDGSTIRRDFARAMMKLSNNGVLTGSQGQVRLNCSMPVYSS